MLAIVIDFSSVVVVVVVVVVVAASEGRKLEQWL